MKPIKKEKIFNIKSISIWQLQKRNYCFNNQNYFVIIKERIIKITI